MSWFDTFAEIRSRDWSTAPDEERRTTAKEVIVITAYGSAAASVVPLPLVDLALLLPFHTGMVATIGHVYGRPLSDTEAKRVVLELGAVAGATIAGHAAVSVFKKIILPGVGGILAAPASFAVTWAFGQLTLAYFNEPDLSKAELRKVFKEAMDEAASVFSKEQFEKARGESKTPGASDPEPASDTPSAPAEPTSAKPAEPPEPTSAKPVEPAEPDVPANEPPPRPPKRHL